MNAPRPLPNVDHLDYKPFWEATRRAQIAVQKCAACGALRFPPRPACPQCGSLEHAWEVQPGSGRLYSWTVTHVPMHPFFADAVPYAVAVVELDGGHGLRMLGRLVGVDPAALRIGLPLRAVFEPVDESVTLVNWETDPDAPS